LPRVPIAEFKEAVKNVFKPFRQVDEICSRICEQVQVDAHGFEGTKMADAVRLNNIAEFMRCNTVHVKRDKNSSPGMNLVMHSEAESSKVSPPDTNTTTARAKLAISQP